MYYSKQQLTNLYKKYFYGEYGEEPTNDYVSGYNGHPIREHADLNNSTRKFGLLPSLVAVQNNYIAVVNNRKFGIEE